MPYIGLQIREGEHFEDVLRDFMTETKRLGSSFKVLKLLGIMDLGRAQFLRFQTDCGRNYAMTAAQNLGRGHIIEREGTYTATFGGGSAAVSTLGMAWSGPVSAAGMQAVALPAYRKTYRGPGKKFWERQFTRPEKENAGPGR